MSAYTNENRVVIKDIKSIAKDYFRSWLFIDLISCLPFDYIFGEAIDGNFNKLLRIARLPRLYRLLRITKVMKILRYMKGNKISDFFKFSYGYTRIISFVGSTLLIVHLSGCIWYFIAKYDDFNPETWVARYLLLLFYLLIGEIIKMKVSLLCI